MSFAFWLFGSRRKAESAPEKGKRQQPAAVSPQMEQRTYLADAAYLLPKDEQEDQRLNFQHHAFYHSFGNHYLAPLGPETRTILDVGTGTGIWPMDMAKQFPHAQIIGVDLALTSLPYVLPGTCLFSQADILQGLPFPSHLFDFTHQRLLVLAIPATHWPKVVQELVRVTRPQGWVEILEVGTTVQNTGPATKRLLSWLQETAQASGIDLTIVSRMGELLRQAGCQTVETQDIPVPLGSWAGRGGEMLKLDALRVFQTLRTRTATHPAEFEKLLTAAVDEWEHHHASYVFHATYGRVVQL